MANALPNETATRREARWSTALRDRPRQWLPSLALIGAIVWGAVWVIPGRSRNPLIETSVWSLLVLTGFVGWGSLVRLAIAPKAPTDVGLRAAWGASLVCFLGGALMIPSLMTRTTALLLVETGLGLSILSLARERASVWRTFRYAARVVRREPGLSIVGLVVAAIVAVRVLAAISDWHVDPYDDEVAYLSFVKKLSDTGSFMEPFSLRRISSYGGQTLFLELLSVRAAPAQGHAFDRGVALLMTALLIVGHRARGRRPALLFSILTVAFVAMLQTGTINTASYFSGAALFIGIFRTLVWLDRRGALTKPSAWKNAVPVALLCAAVCTLRQNYLPVPVIVLAVSYGFFVAKSAAPWRARLAEPLWAAGLALAFLVPWLVVAWQSAHTFLYPVFMGYSNPALVMNASAWNFVRELAFQTRAVLEERQLRTLGMFVLAAALLRQVDARRPLWAIGLGAFGGFFALAHGFTQAEPLHIGRYAFGYLVAFPVAVLLVIGGLRLPAKPGRLHTAAAITLFGLLLQLIFSRDGLWWEFSAGFQNIESAVYSAPRTPETEPAEAALYERLQNAVPPGQRMAVLTDENYYFDYRRNPIWNLDMPCFVSLPPGMPCLRGGESLEGYLRSIGVRYLVWVTPKYSRYYYRREYALDLFVHPDEIWRMYAPYLIDFIDSLGDIQRRHRELYAERGIVVLDLAEPR